MTYQLSLKCRMYCIQRMSGIALSSVTIIPVFLSQFIFGLRKMPELPEVETMVRGIRTDCEGRQIQHTRFPKCPCRPIQISPTRKTFVARTEGRTMNAIRRLAKRIVLEIDSGDRIVIEPRMTGLMLLTDPPTLKHRRLCFELSPAKGKASTLEFWDRRGLGTVSLLKPAEFAELESRLGRDAGYCDRRLEGDPVEDRSRNQSCTAGPDARGRYWKFIRERNSA